MLLNMNEEVDYTSPNSGSQKNTGIIVLNSTLNDVTTSHLWSKYNNLFQDATVTALPRPERLDSSDPNHPEISSPASSESGRICEHDSRYRD